MSALANLIAEDNAPEVTQIVLAPTYTYDGERIYGTGHGVYHHGESFEMHCTCGARSNGWVEGSPSTPWVICDPCGRHYRLELPAAPKRATPIASSGA